MLDNRIHTFITLCKEMNYRKTAETLNMTQPAVTQHIQYLEEYYGCKLFIYDKRTLEITSEGKMLLRHAQSMVYQNETIKQALNQNTQHHLRIGTTKTIGEYVINQHISNYLHDHLHSIDIDVDNTKILIDKLEDGLLDFILVEGSFDKNKYGYIPYSKERFLGICSNDHPFANKIVSISDLIKETILVREQGSGTRQIFETMLTNYNMDLNAFTHIITTSNTNLISQLTQSNTGITFGFEAIANSNKDLSTFEIEDVSLTRSFNYVYLDNPISKEKVLGFDKYK